MHVGKDSSFEVVRRLIEGSVRRLNPGGLLFIVAQNYVPIGRLLAMHFGGKVELDSNGRFTVWKATMERVDISRPHKKRKKKFSS